jgi:hypothetical protein
MFRPCSSIGSTTSNPNPGRINAMAGVWRVSGDTGHDSSKNWPYVLAYAGGFATGTPLGMYLWEKLSQQTVQATLICNGSREKAEAAVREVAFAFLGFNAYLFGEVSPVWRAVCALPMVLIFLTIGLAVFTLLPWPQAGVLRHVPYALAVLAAVGLLWWSSYWNLLGWRF